MRICTYVEEADDAANKVSQRKRNGMTFPLGLSIAVHVLIVAFLLIMGTGHMPSYLTGQLGRVITVSMVSSPQTQSEALGKRLLSGGNKPFTERREVLSVPKKETLPEEKKIVVAETDLSQNQTAAIKTIVPVRERHGAKVGEGTTGGGSNSSAGVQATAPFPSGAGDKGKFAGDITVPPSSLPRYKANDQPPYPVFARLRGHEGTVLLSVEILSIGRVGRIIVKTSSGYEALDQSALIAVKKWIFEPAMQQGVPVAMWVEIPIRFFLNKIND